MTKSPVNLNYTGSQWLLFAYGSELSLHLNLHINWDCFGLEFDIPDLCDRYVLISFLHKRTNISADTGDPFNRKFRKLNKGPDKRDNIFNQSVEQIVVFFARLKVLKAEGLSGRRLDNLWLSVIENRIIRFMSTKVRRGQSPLLWGGVIGHTSINGFITSHRNLLAFNPSREPCSNLWHKIGLDLPHSDYLSPPTVRGIYLNYELQLWTDYFFTTVFYKWKDNYLFFFCALLDLGPAQSPEWEILKSNSGQTKNMIPLFSCWLPINFIYVQTNDSKTTKKKIMIITITWNVVFSLI